MDGNRRWAAERGLSVLKGHQYVANEVLEKLIEHAADTGVEYLTLWAWSTENWSRSKIEVTGIMKLLRFGFVKFGQRMYEKGIRIKVIGNISAFPADIQNTLRGLIEKTKSNTRITVIFALNYGGRDEIVRAVHLIGTTSTITEEGFSQHLDTAGTPDPDVVIRTGGEKRLSGFLLWQCQYSELFFTSWHMPDFTPEKLDEILDEYAGRIRRFGK